MSMCNETAPNKLDDLSGCAVQEGSVGGHIKCKVNTFNSNYLDYDSIIASSMWRS